MCWRALGVEEKFGTVIRKKGDTGRFEKGLFGATEMFVDGFMHLIDAEIMKRHVYDHAILQRLLNEGAITEEVTRETLYHLLERRAIHPRLTAKDFRFLRTFGILRGAWATRTATCYWRTAPGSRQTSTRRSVQTASSLDVWVHEWPTAPSSTAAFFLGPQGFYDWLNAMPKEKRRLIHMKSVTRINQLYGHEELDRLHRKDARFVNTTMMMTLFGGAVSDQLADGRVVSGVGGQYNFVAMAHALPDGHALLQLRSTREERGRLHSSIVFNYGHITIPRHLRDILITEYGIADLRGKTDSEVAIALIEVADSRFQDALVRKGQTGRQATEGLQGSRAIPQQLPRNHTSTYGSTQIRGPVPATALRH